VKTLLLHPDDSPRRGPWASQKWDRIVDLGKCSEATAAAWQILFSCPVVRLRAWRRNVEDPRLAGQILRRGFGQLIDEQGLDWWDLTSLHVHAEVETAIALCRLAAEADLGGELYATRPDWPVAGVGILLNSGVQSFLPSRENDITGRLARAFMNLKAAQWLEIFWDKYDPSYRWRSKLVRSNSRSSGPAVLIPSAYTNVSRGASAYARLVPETQFLLVATRSSGLQFEAPANVSTAHLASYARPTTNESFGLLERWRNIIPLLKQVPELDLLERSGQFAPFHAWLEAGPAVRDAWNEVFEREPVKGVLCGDDTNWYTRLPVILASGKGIPTVDFHHGAFDGRYLLKTMACDTYLAKNEMERDYLTRICELPCDRIVVGRMNGTSQMPKRADVRRRQNIVFFSEPYENAGGRPEEIYRELLPALVILASKQQCKLILKLHPFENPRERASLVVRALGSDTAQTVTIFDGPLTDELLDSARFGLTVESTTVLDCAQRGVPCFQCEWLVSTPFAYVQQFARFGVGRLLRSPAEISDIPRILEQWNDRPNPEDGYEASAADILRQSFSRPPVPVAK